MTLITSEQMLDALRKAVKERGSGFVYTKEYPGDESCQYVAADREGNVGPACIAGYALSSLGVPLGTLRAMDVASEFEASEVVDAPDVLILLEEAGFELDPLALVAVATAQQEQDRDHNWGIAVSRAEESARV